MPFYLGIDEYFLLLIIPAMVFSLAMQIMVKSAYKKQSRVRNARGITGAMAAQMVLESYGVQNVRIETARGRLSDHYDPRTNVIRLSEGVYSQASVAAVGIAAHEAGHAAQHAQNYIPIKVRNAILPVCNIGSMLAVPLMILGLWLDFFGLVTLGLALYALIVVFQLATLPVEFNASRRAMGAIDRRDMLPGGERAGAKKVLNAAAMTYVAALVVSLANLLRFMLRFSRRR